MFVNGKIGAADLQCEYFVNPLGIDILKPRLSWKIQSEERNVMQSAYHIQVAADSCDFAELAWDSGKVFSDRSIHIEYAGTVLKSRTRYYYRVKVWDSRGNESGWSELACWEMGLLETGEWRADWIMHNEGKDKEIDSCPFFRRLFNVKGKVKAARIYATALGLYELHLNGSRVGENLFTPGWTSYGRRLQYQTYDVTGLLQEGENAAGAVLSKGWYAGYLGFEGKNNIYGDRASLLFQLQITYEDGTEDMVISDENWKTATGPILMSELYHGETFDARLAMKGWSRADFDDICWKKAALYGHGKEILIAQKNVPVKKIEEIKPVKFIYTPQGDTVIDFGQNMVGWVRFSADGNAGEEVIIRHAEVLDRNGNFYTDNIRKARQTIHYILEGAGTEVFEPHFTFQGFRYIKLERYPGKPVLENFTGIVVHSDMRRTGHFECSSKLINQLQHNIVWGQKGNFLDVPTDCPQRDERLGWTGDAQVFARTACFNMHSAAFFSKWLGDLKAEQKENGSIPMVIPEVANEIAKNMSNSSCGWGDAAVIIPWTVYLCYGDLRILEEQYESMKSYVEYIRSVSEKGLLWNSGFHFGDWLALDADPGSYRGATPNDLTATAFYAYSTDILARAAKLLKKNADADFYGRLYKDITKAFRDEFLTPNGRLAAPTQTAHVLVLMFELAEERDRKRLLDRLLKLLEKRNWHLDTGFLGTPYLCHVLSKHGRADAAYKLLLQTDYPSWLYQVEKGATTIWEHWDGIKPDGTFWSEDMNSFNHYAYGSIGDWMYRVVAGLDTDTERAGYKHILVNPVPCREITGASAELESMYGTIKVKWSIDNCNMEMHISIPHNTTATVRLSYAIADTLKVNPPVEKALQTDKTDKGVNLELGSGSWCLLCQIDASMVPGVPETVSKAQWEL